MKIVTRHLLLIGCLAVSMTQIASADIRPDPSDRNTPLNPNYRPKPDPAPDPSPTKKACGAGMGLVVLGLGVLGAWGLSRVRPAESAAKA